LTALASKQVSQIACLFISVAVECHHFSQRCVIVPYLLSELSLIWEI